MSTGIMDEIIKEVKRGRKKERWPVHVVAQACMVSANAGSLTKESLNMKYRTNEEKEEQRKRLKAEAIKVAAAAIRFIENLK